MPSEGTVGGATVSRVTSARPGERSRERLGWHSRRGHGWPDTTNRVGNRRSRVRSQCPGDADAVGHFGRGPRGSDLLRSRGHSHPTGAGRYSHSPRLPDSLIGQFRSNDEVVFQVRYSF